MIARIWHGWAAVENADDYESLLKDEIIPEIRQKGIDGFKKIQVLKREHNEEIEFTTIMWFDNLESIKQFAGDDSEKAYVPEKARKLLSRFDKKTKHYERIWEA